MLLQSLPEILRLQSPKPTIDCKSLSLFYKPKPIQCHCNCTASIQQHDVTNLEMPVKFLKYIKARKREYNLLTCKTGESPSVLLDMVVIVAGTPEKSLGVAMKILLIPTSIPVVTICSGLKRSLLFVGQSQGKSKLRRFHCFTVSKGASRIACPCLSAHTVTNNTMKVL